MSVETTAWAQLRSVMTAEDERRPVTRDTLRRMAPSPARTAAS